MMKNSFNAAFDAFLPVLRAQEGIVSVYAENLITGEAAGFQADADLIAASVIKLPILITAFSAAARGELSMDERFAVQPEAKMPSCGALTYLHDGLEVTLRDLCVLMIILSDNTATNMLIDRLGIDSINEEIARQGLTTTVLRRKLFDSEAAARGLENSITAREMALLLRKLYHGACVSPEADAEMLSILRDQRLNGKIPFFLHGYEIAHKTGEDSGITHDVGIVYAGEPLVLCFASNRTDVPRFERVIQDMARAMVTAQ